MQLLPIVLTPGCECVAETVCCTEEHWKTQQVVLDLLVATKLADLVQNIVEIHFETLCDLELIAFETKE